MNVQWKNTECSIENTIQDIQIFYGKDYNYIYCYYNNITINKREFVCPDRPFKLRITSNFTVNLFRYLTTDIVSDDYRGSYNWSDKLNVFISDVRNVTQPLDLDKYYKELNELIETESISSFKSNHKILLLVIGCCVLALVLALLVYLVIRVWLMTSRNRGLRQFKESVAYETARELVRVIAPRRYRRPVAISAPIVEDDNVIREIE